MEGHLLGVDRSSLLDPVIADLLNLDQIGQDDRLVVGEIESKLGRSDEGTLLINMVAKNLSESKVQDVGTGVVVPDGPSSQLIIS